MAKKKNQAAAPVSAAPVAPTPVPAPTPAASTAGTQEARDRMATVRAARGTGDNDNDTFTAIPEAKRTDAQKAAKALPPQAQVIANTIIASGTITRASLEKAVTGVLVTRQPVGRIITYYQKLLVERGICTLVKAPAAPTPVATA